MKTARAVVGHAPVCMHADNACNLQSTVVLSTVPANLVSSASTLTAFLYMSDGQLRCALTVVDTFSGCLEKRTRNRDPAGHSDQGCRGASSVHTHLLPHHHPTSREE